MTFIESICIAKVYAVALGLSPRNSITKEEKNMAAFALKRVADQSPCWTQHQREMYKLLVDIVKEI